MFDSAGRLERRIASSNLPLGIMKTSEGVQGIERFSWVHSHQLLLVSDGIVEACNADDVAFGDKQLIRVVEQRPPGVELTDALQQALQQHLKGSNAHDDMSMLVIDCPAGSD
jgi:serine phosphatase RsbU (regulator of sigma subunit)